MGGWLRGWYGVKVGFDFVLGGYAFMRLVFIKKSCFVAKVKSLFLLPVSGWSWGREMDIILLSSVG